MVVVLFRIKVRDDVDRPEYDKASGRMVEIVSSLPGFVSVEGFDLGGGSELVLARFESDEAVRAWKAHPEHLRTQERGRTEFFASYEITVAEEIRHYDWTATAAAATMS
jgi:heme-degrading monooxygenase HmoA